MPEWSQNEVAQVRKLLAKYGPARLVRLIGEQCHETALAYDIDGPTAAFNLRRAGSALEHDAARDAVEQVSPWMFSQVARLCAIAS